MNASPSSSFLCSCPDETAGPDSACPCSTDLCGTKTEQKHSCSQFIRLLVLSPHFFGSTLSRTTPRRQGAIYLDARSPSFSAHAQMSLLAFREHAPDAHVPLDGGELIKPQILMVTRGHMFMFYSFGSASGSEVKYTWYPFFQMFSPPSCHPHAQLCLRGHGSHVLLCVNCGRLKRQKKAKGLSSH